MAYEVNGKTIEADEEGFLVNINDWNEELAGLVAKDEGIDMSPSTGKSSTSCANIMPSTRSLRRCAC